MAFQIVFRDIISPDYWLGYHWLKSVHSKIVWPEGPMGSKVYSGWAGSPRRAYVLRVFCSAPRAHDDPSRYRHAVSPWVGGLIPMAL